MKKCALLVILLIPCLLASCVERKLSFTSNLSGTQVAVNLDGHPIGDAPTHITFENYGLRDWQARAEGYKTAEGRVELEVPWYQWPVFDFFAEVLIPFTIVDEHRVEITMRPLEEKSIEGLQERAEQFRTEAIKEAKKEPPIGDKRK